MHAQFLADKTLRSPPGAKLHVEYVHIDRLRLGNRTPMAIGDVKEKFELILQNRPAYIFPCPVGTWTGDPSDPLSRFTVHDGRHSYLAYQMHGYEHVLVAWIETQPV